MVHYLIREKNISIGGTYWETIRRFRTKRKALISLRRYRKYNPDIEFKLVKEKEKYPAFTYKI